MTQPQVHVSGRGLRTLEDLVRDIEAAGLLDQPLVRALVEMALEHVPIERQAAAKVSARPSVDDWLRGQLANGPVGRQEIMRRGVSAGFSESTVDRASERIGVVKRKGGLKNMARWSLPET